MCRKCRSLLTRFPSETHGGYTLEGVYADAMNQINHLRDSNRLSEEDYRALTANCNGNDVIVSVKSAIERRGQRQSDQNMRCLRILEGICERLERLSTAIDMLAQSTPWNVTGLVWGALKFFVIISRDLSQAFESIPNVLEDLSQSLEAVKVYVAMYGSSDIQCLRRPLVDLYVATLLFAAGALQLLHESSLAAWLRSASGALRKDLSEKVARVQSASKQVERMANAEHKHETHQIHAALADIRADLSRSNSLATSLRGQPEHPGCNDAPVDRLSGHFTGRGNDLEKLKRLLLTEYSHKPTRCAIYGMPGLGKTQLALKYAKKSFSEGQYVRVFWTSASTVDKIADGLLRILNLVNHPERSNNDFSAKLLAARLWLERNPDWLLVLDNVDKGTITFLKEHLPRPCKHGHILFTTRTGAVAKNLQMCAGEMHAAHALEALDIKDCVDLFHREAGHPDEYLGAHPVEMEKLVKQLGCLPLAITQAAAYQSQTRKSAAEMLTLYNDKGTQFDLWQWEDGLVNYEHRSVAATFLQQLVELDRTAPNAGILLRAMCYLDSEHIAIEMLVLGATAVLEPVDRPKPSLKDRIRKLASRRHRRRPNRLDADLRTLVELLSSPVDLSAALQSLLSLSLIEQSNQRYIVIHDLTCAMVRQVDTRDHDSEFFGVAVSLVEAASRTIAFADEPEHHSTGVMLTPHVYALKDADEAKDIHSPHLESACTHTASFLHRLGHYIDSEKLHRHVLESREGRLGRDHLDTLSAAHNLAISQVYVLRTTEASEKFERALLGLEKMLGHSHPDTLSAVHNLAVSYQQQEDFGKALSLFARARKGQERVLGLDHPETLRTIQSIALHYLVQKQFHEAKPLFERALVSREKALGADHPDTLYTVHCLGSLHMHQGHYDEAEELLERALAGRETRLGKSHPDTLHTVDDLRRVYEHKGLLEKAQVLHERIHSALVERFGRDHLSTIREEHDLGIFHHRQKHFDTAQGYYESALAGSARALGNVRPETVQCLARLHEERGFADQAASLLLQHGLDPDRGRGVEASSGSDDSILPGIGYQAGTTILWSSGTWSSPLGCRINFYYSPFCRFPSTRPQRRFNFSLRLAAEYARLLKSY